MYNPASLLSLGHQTQGLGSPEQHVSQVPHMLQDQHQILLQKGAEVNKKPKILPSC